MTSRALISPVQRNKGMMDDYMFPKPGRTQPSQKWAYVKAVNVDGVPSLVASGFYPE